MPLLKKDNGEQCETAEENNAFLLDSKFPLPLSVTPLDTTRYTGLPGPLDKVLEEEVTRIIKPLPTNKAPGPDRTCNQALKAPNWHHPAILPSLFTVCLALGYFPASWRSGWVVFVPKPGKDLNIADGYRPITLLSTLGKAFEKILNTRIIEHYNEEQPLHWRQFGFCRGIGMEEAVHQAVDML